jgi:pimeloyl-ACP methyl ester carboxylesterase
VSDAALPVVLLHGCGGTRQATFEVPGWIAALQATGRAVHVPDLPGHGMRSPSHNPDDYADLAGSLLSRLPAGPFMAVGYSLGAKLLLEIAVRDPQRVRRAVLGGLGDNLFAPETVAPAAALALEHGVTAETPPPVREFLRHWDGNANQALAVAAVLRRPANPVFTTQRLRQVTMPILLVNGAVDPVAARVEQLLAALPTLQRHVLPGVGHFDLPVQAEFRRLAIAFLTQEDASS